MLIFELTVQVLVQGSIYALIAVGLTLVYGLLRILHVAHAGLFTLGGYIGVLVTNATGSLTLALLAAMVFVGALDVGVYRLCYQPILDKPPYVALIASIGLFVAMEEIFRLVFGPYGISYTAPPLLDSVTVGGMNLKQAELGVMAGTVVLIGGLALLAGRTRIGAAWRATVTDPAMAQSFGIDIVKVRYLNFFIGSALADAADAMPAKLPLGYLKRLEVARALALSPHMLLLDEPLAGLNHVEAGRMADTIQSLNRDGFSIVLIEHNLGEVLRICSRLIVLDNGRNLSAGDPRQVMAEPAVRAAYLGEGVADA